MANAAEADSAVQIDLSEQDVTVTITVRWALNYATQVLTRKPLPRLSGG